jgi:hypothetical protein
MVIVRPFYARKPEEVLNADIQDFVC